jgi:hypothetical protein
MAGVAGKDNADTARKARAAQAGANLFPETTPENGQVVTAINPRRVGAIEFEAQYRRSSPQSPDGAFYSSRDGEYVMLEGPVESWREIE